MDEWVAIARTCPETKPRARLKWLKDNHGLLQNHGSHVLSEAFPPGEGWRRPRQADRHAVDRPGRDGDLPRGRRGGAGARRGHPTARKGYTAWSRQFQFAAARPIKGGKAMLGLALAPDANPRLEAPKNEGWSERLKSRTLLGAPADVDGEIETLLRAAWEHS